MNSFLPSIHRRWWAKGIVYGVLWGQRMGIGVLPIKQVVGGAIEVAAQLAKVVQGYGLMHILGIFSGFATTHAYSFYQILKGVNIAAHEYGMYYFKL